MSQTLIMKKKFFKKVFGDLNYSINDMAFLINHYAEMISKILM